MDYYSALIGKQILTHATIWIYLENIKLVTNEKYYDSTYMKYLE
jgi:hypothetical protein